MGSSVQAVREWIGRTPEVVEKMRATRAARPRVRLKREAGTDLGVARLADPETVRVKPWRESLAKNKWLTINRSDFDPAKHELFEEKAKPKVAAHRSHHQPKLAQPRRAVVH
jgi:hypothetical protein